MIPRNSLFAGIAMIAFAVHAPAAHAQSEAAPAAPAEAPASATPPPPAPYTAPAAAPAEEAPASASPAPTSAAPPAPAAVAPSAVEAPAVAAPSDDAALGAAQSLATLIEDVQVVGPWMDGTRSGIWRTVMMQVGTAEKETYRFFIQQIESGGGAKTILSTTEITEIPGIDGAIVGYRADEPSEDDPSGLSLFFDIVPSDGEIAETYELHFLKDQPYTFGPATN